MKPSHELKCLEKNSVVEPSFSQFNIDCNWNIVQQRSSEQGLPFPIGYGEGSLACITIIDKFSARQVPNLIRRLVEFKRKKLPGTEYSKNLDFAKIWERSRNFQEKKISLPLVIKDENRHPVFS